MFGKRKNKELENVLLPLLKQSYIKNEADCIRINNEYNKVIMAVGYPREIQEGWLDRIISSEGNFDLCMFIEPAEIQTIMTSLNNELVKQKADMISAQNKGIVNPVLAVQHEDTYNTLKGLQTGKEKLFNFSFYANARAVNKNELELLGRKIESEFNSIMIVPKIPALRMQQAVQSIMPLCNDKLRVQRNIPSNALSACFPFTSSFLDVDNEGIMFGVNNANNIPIILDQYKFTNYNGIILGSSGGGKSFFVKLYIIRNLLRGMKTFIIDPQGEYVDLAEKYKGQIVELSRESDTIINPLDLMGKDFGDKMLSLMALFGIMFGELTEVQKSILDKAVIETYKNKSIISNAAETWTNEPPTLLDLHDVLEKERKSAGKNEEVTYDALLNRLRIYCKGSFSFLSRKTSINLEKNLICFNIKEMPEQVKPIMMFLVLDFLFEKMQESKERKLIVVDEAWSLLRQGEHSEYLFRICKTARKFGAGLVVITQEVNDLLNSNAGNAMLANTAWKLLLRQEPAVMQDIVEKFNLNNEERNFLLTAEAGQGLLFAMNDRISLRVVASEKEYDIITTNPDELRRRELLGNEIKEESEIDAEVYQISKTYFREKDLNEKHIKFLKSQGFVECQQMGLEQGGRINYLILPTRENESIEHQFLVQLIYEELLKHTQMVQRYAVQKPDIVFSANGKRYAVEVETGTIIRDKEKFMNKLKLLKDYDEWFFVVTDCKMKKLYAEYGETLTRVEVKEKIEELFYKEIKASF